MDIWLLLRQSAALMVTGMIIVFGMLLALIAVISANARVVRHFKWDRPSPSKGRPVPAPADAAPVAAVIAAALHAYENDSSRPA